MTNFILGASNAPLKDCRNIAKTDSSIKAFERALRGVGTRMFFDMFCFVFGGKCAAKELCALVHKIIDESIEDAYKDCQRPIGVNKEAYDLIHDLAQPTRSRVDL
ncbi:hypothetical protein N7G274_002443 [Stereocaulon virgatum]|uniref:Uncharacterized protein n=1 Tax=Stereocaulon virgatum TaxID=373712 RepID=A0ABR4AFT3_9LECA